MNNKKMKSVLVIVLVGVMSIISLTKINAINTNENNMFFVKQSIYEDSYSIVVEDGKEYLVDDMGLKHIFYTSDGIELTPQEALIVLNEQDIDYNRNVIQRGVVYPYSNEVILSSSSKIKGSRAKVTPDVRGPASISTGNSITTSESFGGSINVSATIKSLIVAEVKAEVGFIWNTTSTSASTFNTTFNVPSNKIGAVYFTPYLRQFNMYYYNASGQQYSIIAKSPIKLSSGFTDGLYELITS